jgi:glycosyltransferase involved in cell wall biosynthesis
MRLLIVSHMPHHHLKDGTVVGWAATVRELDRLATRFDSVRHVACLHAGDAPASAIPYTAKNVTLVPVPPSGAEGFLGKLDVLRISPRYIRTILRELADADMVHVRAPAHIALIAIVMLMFRRAPSARWFKYAGNWSPTGRESPSYAIQRHLLKSGLPRGLVTVNGKWSEQPAWIRTFFNPSLDDQTIERAAKIASAKQLTSPIQLVFVGRIETPKGAGRAIAIVARLRDRGVAARLDLIGDGAERGQFEALARELAVADLVAFQGWQPPQVVEEFYRRAHLQLMPTTASEGWPKVLSEGMAFGVVPVASTVSSIPQYLEQLQTGVALLANDLDAFVAAIEAYTRDPARWARESKRAAESTRWFSFRHYLESVDSLLEDLGVDAIEPH